MPLASFTSSEDIDVPQQAAGGGWRCGLHVIINASILAMGLAPNHKASYSDDVYAELRTLAKAAVAGLLDWQTLVAWFFCHQLTVERSLDFVLLNRRFTTTHFWENETRLFERILEIQEEDQLLASATVEEALYDHGNNVLVADSSDEDSDDNDDDDDDDEESDVEESDDEGLTRQTEEVDSPYNRHN